MKTNAWSSRLRRVALVGALALATAFAPLVVAPAPAQAAPVTGFNPGNIISDSLFYNGNAMTASEVQSFLNQRVTRCTIGDPGRAAGSAWGNTTIASKCLRNFSMNTTTKAANANCAAYTGRSGETAADILRIVEQVDSEWVGTHVDTGNSMMVWEDPVEATRALAPFAVSSHLKDHVVIVEAGEPLVVGVTNGTGSAECAECYRILCAESPLQRVVIEVCYGYSAPFRRPEAEGAGGRLGEGAFRVVEGDQPPSWLLPHPGRVPADQREELLAWQSRSVEESLAFVRSLAD